ncbi:hypothetical protein [Campylobacter fetus]|uniref:hypothetical protein n=1 Tax=Campylobacter fetus TaxID=196 RepID=UPI00192F6E64|nr:hypothetical protein [Campylobacter fetus]
MHFGTKPHIIRAKKAKGLVWNGSGYPTSGALVGGDGRTSSHGIKAFAKQVNHPGTKAQPYLENALNSYMSGGGLARAKTALAKDIRDKVLNDVKQSLKLD